MKKLIASILTVLTVGASAQMTYVTTLDGDDISAPMFTEGEGMDNFIDNGKYLISKRPEGEYNRYDIINSDFSIYKSIKIDTTGWGALGLYLDDIFFSDHLYNSDDKVEIIYALEIDGFWNNDNSEWVDNVPFKTVVIDEDGVELEIIDNVTIEHWNVFQLNGKTYFKGDTGNEDEVAIYEAAGTLPCTSCSSSESTPTQKSPEKVYDINLFPNPTTNQITLAINTDKTGMKVHIYSIDGKLVKSASVVNGNNLIDTADLVAGNYIYNVQTDTEVIHASQFIKK